MDMKAEEKTSFRVCSYNVGVWTDGVRPGLEPEELDGRIAAWNRFLDDFDPDFLLCEEASGWLDSAHTVTAYETLFARRFPEHWQTTDPQYNGLVHGILLLGKYPIRNAEVLSFSSGSGRPLVTFETELCGKNVRFFVVHPSIEAHSEGIRQKDLAELASLLAGCAYGVAAGDYNTYDISEFDTHFGAFPMANHGAFGDFETWPHKSSIGVWSRCLDNIITTPSLAVKSVRLGTEVLSDHMPIMAEIAFDEDKE